MFARWEIEAVVALVLLAAAFLWLGVHDSNVSKAATAPIIAGVQAATEAASAAEAVKEARQDAEQQGNLREAEDQNTQRVADTRDLDAFVRLHDGSARGQRPARAASASASAASGAGSLPAADMVPADVYARALDAARDASEYADCLATSGRLCALDYRTLKAP